MTRLLVCLHFVTIAAATLAQTPAPSPNDCTEMKLGQNGLKPVERLAGTRALQGRQNKTTLRRKANSASFCGRLHHRLVGQSKQRWLLSRKALCQSWH